MGPEKYSSPDATDAFILPQTHSSVLNFNMPNKSDIRCVHCGRELKSVNGLAKHKCRALPSAKARRNQALRNRTLLSTIQNSGQASSYNEISPRLEDTLNTNEYDMDYMWELESKAIGQELETSMAGERIVPENETDNENNNSDSDTEQQNEYGYSLPAFSHDEGSPEVLGSRGTSSTGTRVTWIEEYNKKEVSAGKIVEEDSLSPEERPKKASTIDKDDPWWPFGSRHDWNLASWFSRAGCGKGDIEDYFKEPDFFQNEDSTNSHAIRTHIDLMRHIYSIPYGIPGGDHWQQQEIRIKSQMKDGKAAVYFVKYRSVKECISFLLGFPPFAADMAFAPVRKFHGDRAARVYDEMYTGEWWWETQDKLPPGATVVPIILATDKTLMTKLRGDQSAWPVYLTIGNLSRKVRRKQTVPSVLLLGLLPICKNITKMSDQDLIHRIKSELYHGSMRIILKGSYNSILLYVI